MFRQLDYQDRVLDTIDSYLDALKDKKARSDKIAALAADDHDLGLVIPDFAKEAWETLKAAGRLPSSRAAIPFSERRDGCGRPVPNIVLKVPTGGGKTWLAVSAVSHIMGRYLSRNTGFVLWVVPNEAIYTQTLKHLKDRQHPYRQALDRAAAGRVRIMEKTDRLDAKDLEANLAYALGSGMVALIDERKATDLCADRYPALIVMSTTDLLLADSIASPLQADGLKECLFRALTVARMRVPDRHLAGVCDLLGPDRCRECRSLPAAWRQSEASRSTGCFPELAPNRTKSC